MSDRERILDRLSKLLALADSPNGHEAATARRLATGIMVKHGITEQDVEGHQTSGYYELPMGAKGFEKVWKFSLITATAAFCDCEAVALNVGGRRKIRLVGERANVERASELFGSLIKALADLEKLEAAWLSDPNQAVYSSPAEYADSFRRGATVAVIQLMMGERPEHFGLKRKPAHAPAPTPTTPPESSEASDPLGWATRIWSSVVRKFLGGKHSLSSSSLALSAWRVESPLPGVDEEKKPKSKVREKYAPRQVKEHLEDAADEGAYWRGYQSARFRVVLPTEKTST